MRSLAGYCQSIQKSSNVDPSLLNYPLSDDVLDTQNEVSADAELNSLAERGSTNPNANPYEAIANSLIRLTPVNDYIKSRDIPERVLTINVATLYRNNFPVISCSAEFLHAQLSSAAIGQIFEVGIKKVLMSNGYCRGLSFSSWLKTGDCIRPRDEPVPVFDCRGPFKLSSYHTCPASKVDPENGSIVLMIFTLNRYRELSYNITSYNIQVVLQLADLPSDEDGEKPATPLPAYLMSLEPVGVTGIVDTKNVFAVQEDDDTAEKFFSFSCLGSKLYCNLLLVLFSSGSAALASLADRGGSTIHHLWRTEGSADNDLTVEPHLYWAWPDNSYALRPSSPSTASRDEQMIIGSTSSYQFEEVPPLLMYRQEADSEAIHALLFEEGINTQFNRRLLADIFRYIANELNRAVPNENLRELAANMTYLLWSSDANNLGLG
ncbi:hypothetical protein IW262DRAFT_1298234 [Armillaria fumosa]|nr:hypothetical protein IW262DRAFT_1298234 [Armillaria fumosa]